MSTPFLTGEPASFGYTERDSLLTIQGFAPKEATDRRKQAPATHTHFSQVVSGPASKQAQFFLNAYFDNISGADKDRIRAEFLVFQTVQKEANMAEDSPSIPSNLANLFLQRLGRTMTPTEFKAQFKEVDTNFDGQMAFLEYLVWNFKLGSPAHAVYRPQVQSAALTRAVTGALNAERALTGFDDELAAKTEAAETLTGVKGTRAKQELNTFRENTNTASLNADLANAYEKLIKARAGLVERGTEWWANTLAAEAEARAPHKKQ